MFDRFRWWGPWKSFLLHQSIKIKVRFFFPFTRDWSYYWGRLRSSRCNGKRWNKTIYFWLSKCYRYWCFGSFCIITKRTINCKWRASLNWFNSNDVFKKRWSQPKQSQCHEKTDGIRIRRNESKLNALKPSLIITKGNARKYFSFSIWRSLFFWDATTSWFSCNYSQL